MRACTAKEKHCFVCDEKVARSTYREHQNSHAELVKTIKFSNSMKDAVRTTCKVCGLIMKMIQMRTHTQKDHGMSIKEYKDKYNQHFFDEHEKILHECKICGEYLLLDSDCISGHLKSGKPPHNITHAQYNAQHMVLFRDQQAVDPLGGKYFESPKKTEQSSMRPLLTENREDCLECRQEFASANAVFAHSRSHRLFRMSLIKKLIARN